MPKTKTIVLERVDVALLKRQAATVGALARRESGGTTERERKALEGVWNLLHAMLDRAEGR